MLLAQGCLHDLITAYTQKEFIPSGGPEPNWVVHLSTGRSFRVLTFRNRRWWLCSVLAPNHEVVLIFEK